MYAQALSQSEDLSKLKSRPITKPYQYRNVGPAKESTIIVHRMTSRSCPIQLASAWTAIELPETRGVPLPETLADCAVHGDAKAKIQEAE